MNVYSTVNKSLIELLGIHQEPKDAVRIAESVKLNNADLMKLLQYMHTAFKKSMFNDSSKFGLLMPAVMVIP